MSGIWHGWGSVAGLVLMRNGVCLQVPRMRTQAVLGVATALAEAYQLVYDCLSDPVCGYSQHQGIEAALTHTPEEIRTILGIV